MQSKAATVPAYLASLPADRRDAIEQVRAVILKNLDRGPDGKSGFIEGMQYGMIGYAVPHSIFPHGYHCDPKQPLPYIALASQKNHLALYLMCTYGHVETNEWFRREWTKSGKKLDMGKSCIRFQKAEDLALNVIGELLQRVTLRKYLDHYARALADMGKDITGQKIAPAKKSVSKKAPMKKKAVKKTAKKKVAKSDKGKT